MNTLSSIWQWIGDNASALGIVIPIVTAIGSALWAFLSYMDLKKRELREKQLHLYHDLVNRLVSPDSAGIKKMESQIALIYELLNFPTYFHVTEKIFESGKTQFSNPRLHAEFDAALKIIRKKMKKPNPATAAND